MRRIAFYESWQMECCGAPFSVGDVIEWLVFIRINGVNVPQVKEKIEFLYEAHSSEWQRLFVCKGKVESIRILYSDHVRTEDFEYTQLPEGKKVIESQTAKGFEKGPEGQEAEGYIVTLTDCRTRRAREDEVTFM